VTAPATLSVRKKLLLVLFDLTRGNPAVVVDMETIAMAAWAFYPQEFGLKRYRQPNVNAVWARFCASDWLIVTGYVLRPVGDDGPLGVSITEPGAQAARLLVGGGHRLPGPHVDLALLAASPLPAVPARVDSPTAAPPPRQLRHRRAKAPAPSPAPPTPTPPAPTPEVRPLSVREERHLALLAQHVRRGTRKLTGADLAEVTHHRPLHELLKAARLGDRTDLVGVLQTLQSMAVRSLSRATADA